MQRMTMALAALTVTTGLAHAGGIDRSGQDNAILFEPGRAMELSFGSVMPKVSGTDIATGAKIGNVAADYTQLSFGYKADLTDTLSYSLTLDSPFGADVAYGGSPFASSLGGTTALARTTALTGLVRYKVGGNVSVFGGPRIQQADAHVDLRGLAYGPFNGYSVDLSSNTAVGYVVGAAYEKPEIALRVALTYNSAITHKFDTLETVGPVTVGTAPTKVDTPQSINLDFQTGVAANTLVFGQIRWVEWSAFRLDPAFFTSKAGGGLIALKDTTTFTLGVGRKFSDAWSGAFSVTYEKPGAKLVSPLAPTTGQIGATLAAVYTVNNMKITAGINYTELGDADPETGTPDTARARFTGNSAVGVGVKVGFTF